MTKKRENFVILRVKKTKYQKAAEKWQRAKNAEETSICLIEWIAACDRIKELNPLWAHIKRSKEKDAFLKREKKINEREASKRTFLSCVPK